jgi:hypothetical protein
MWNKYPKISEQFFTTLMLSHEKNGQVELVVKEYSKLRARALSPSTETLEVLMRAHANQGSINEIVKAYYFADLYSMEPSLEMHKILIEAHIKVNEEIVAWNRAFSAIETINSHKSDVKSWDIPSDLLLPLAQSAKGKNFSYVIDRLTIGSFPQILIPHFLTVLMSHWVSLKTNDIYLSMDTHNSLMPGGVFSKLPLDSFESYFIAYSIIAKAQKGDLNEALELFESNSQKLNPEYLISYTQAW